MFERIAQRIDNTWFYRSPNVIWRYLLVFVNGDSLIIAPFLGIILLFGFLSLEFMGIMLGLFVAIRSIGEMFYWMFQQFGPRTYRPYDFGLIRLDNNAIYIVYQLLGLVGAVIGISLVLLLLFY